ncbi:MAG: BatD family protein [Deltaproteobacteria bacterium]|nr:BatD family protein [Deltaproteobacteria bacterium]
MKRVLVILLALCGIAAAEPTAQFQLAERGQPHAGVPFTLQLIVDGFDEQPQPDAPKLDIAGAHVTFAGVSPSVSRQITSINGQVSQSTVVRWVFQWRVDVAKAGSVHVPSVTVTQGSKRAIAKSGDLDLDEVPTTDAMKLELTLPDRPVFVGETFEAKLTWLFRSQPEDQAFSVPMMSLDDFTISAPPATDPRKALQLHAGSKDLQLPYEIDQIEQNGQKWNRVVLHFYAAPRKPGKIDVPPASVVAALAVGRPDFFGNAPTRQFRTSDQPHTLDVKPLPETDKPASFSGAVGSQFSIAVATSRSVVQLGEPVELDITIKSAERLDTLALPRLDTLLPKESFTVPPDPPTGTLSDDGKTKTFKVTAQVTGPTTTEVPALAFSYFDPVRGTYQTIHSDPIALSVKGGTVVSTNDVVAASQKTTTPTKVQPTEDLTRVGADLALSSDPDKRPLGGSVVWILAALLYLVPLALLALRTWQLRTQTSREEAAEVRAARRRAEDELARAAKTPARDAAGPLASALRAYARTVDRNADEGGLLARIETESFAPGAASEPLSQDTRDKIADLIKRWSARPARVPKAAVVVVLLAALAPHARADALSDGRAAYQQAMTQTDASARKTAFARAAALLGEAARTRPDRPELLADWGNAALAAGDLAHATLAYRRALALDAENARAHHNLAWLRSRQPELFRPADEASGDALFFFHSWPRARRLLVGAFAFAAAILLLVPWRGRRRRGLTGLALLPAAIWIAMTVSLLLEERHTSDAVVIDDAVLRAADAMGAPPALTQPLPKGAEVTILEQRDAWTKVRLSSGTAGWVPAGSVEPVTR